MNRPILRVYGFVAILFALLIAFTSRWTIFEASSLRANALNKRGVLQQQALLFDDGKGLSTQEQLYDPTPIVNALRQRVDRWRQLPDSGQWGVTPSTGR